MKNLNRQSGFTLIELILVITLIGIGAAVAVPSFSSITGANLDQQASRFVQDISWAQKMSRFNRDQGNVSFFIMEDRYAFARNMEYLQGHDNQNIDEVLLEGTTFQIPDDGGWQFVLFEFNENGLPSNGEDIEIVLNGTDERSRTIRVEGTTGYIRII